MKNNIKIIINLFYSPVQELKDMIEADYSHIYLPVNGGSSLRGDSWCDKWLKYDDEGDNISSKNSLLNEFTAIYWAWKNSTDIANAEYVGFCHYRRFFPKLAVEDAPNHDITVAKPVFPCPLSLEQQYGIYHVAADLDACIRILDRLDQTFCSGFLEYVRTNCVNYAPCNMFIMKKDLFFEWCKFVFSLLPELERVIDVAGRDNYQKRAICFLCERVFGYWVWSRRDRFDIIDTKIDERLEYKNNSLNERGTY